MKRHYRNFTLIAAALAISGCASFPDKFDSLPPQDEVAYDLEKKWASMPAVKYIESKTGASVRKRKPLPHMIADKPLSFNLGAKASLAEFVAALETQNLRMVLKATAAKSNERVQISSYEGTVGEFMEMLALTHDLDYEHLDGVILITQGIRYMVSVPQNKELMERIPAALAGLGATNIKTDIDSGLVTYEASSGVSRDVDLYLERMANNSSMVALQVAVIDVRLNRDAGNGFDWNEFSAKWGSAIDATTAAATGAAQVAQAVAVPATLPGIASTVAATVAQRALGSLATLNGSGVGLKLDEAKFSLVAAVKLLSKYGKAQTNQDVLISTLSGSPVKISSGSQIPYVSGVGAVTAAGGAVSGSINTSTVKSGLNIDIVPRYDAADHLVVTNIKAKLSSLVRFRELSAGNTVGTISQPEIQELEFENISRMRPGEIIMLGGIAYDQVSENYTSLSGLEKSKLGSETQTTNRHAIFIVIRPSVTIFAQDASGASRGAAQAQTQRPTQHAAAAPAPEPAKPLVAVAAEEFSGDAADLLRGVATQFGMAFEIEGPDTPLPIRLKTANRNLRSLLSAIGAQLGNQADLVLTNTHVRLKYKRVATK